MIIIEGLIGVGKSTLAEEMAKRTNYRFIREPVAEETDPVLVLHREVASMGLGNILGGCVSQAGVDIHVERHRVIIRRRVMAAAPSAAKLRTVPACLRPGRGGR